MGLATKPLIVCLYSSSHLGGVALGLVFPTPRRFGASRANGRRLRPAASIRRHCRDRRRRRRVSPPRSPCSWRRRIKRCPRRSCPGPRCTVKERITATAALDPPGAAAHLRPERSSDQEEPRQPPPWVSVGSSLGGTLPLGLDGLDANQVQKLPWWLRSLGPATTLPRSSPRDGLGPLRLSRGPHHQL